MLCVPGTVAAIGTGRVKVPVPTVRGTVGLIQFAVTVTEHVGRLCGGLQFVVSVALHGGPKTVPVIGTKLSTTPIVPVGMPLPFSTCVLASSEKVTVFWFGKSTEVPLWFTVIPLGAGATVSVPFTYLME